jgi:hypothetical protein
MPGPAALNFRPQYHCAGTFSLFHPDLQVGSLTRKDVLTRNTSLGPTHPHFWTGCLISITYTQHGLSGQSPAFSTSRVILPRILWHLSGSRLPALNHIIVINTLDLYRSRFSSFVSLYLII